MKKRKGQNGHGTQAKRRIRGRKWQAQIQWRGKPYYLGLFDDEIEAARARDRKAYELHGPHAYLNLPEDYDR